MKSAGIPDVTILGLRVMLIEDDEAVATSFCRAIERSGMPTYWAATGADAMANKSSFRPDVVLVDLELPDTSGVVLIKWLVEQRDCGVIVVSGAGDEADRILGLELGADDYVAKPPNMRELIARIHAVHRRTGQQVSPVVATDPPAFSLGDLRIDCARRTVHGPDGARVMLTAAEYSALEALLRAKGQIVTRDQLSKTALRRPWRPEDRSVDQLILYLRQKLAPDADGQSLIESVRGCGYLLRMTGLAPAG